MARYHLSDEPFELRDEDFTDEGKKEMMNSFRMLRNYIRTMKEGEDKVKAREDLSNRFVNYFAEYEHRKNGGKPCCQKKSKLTHSCLN